MTSLIVSGLFMGVFCGAEPESAPASSSLNGVEAAESTSLASREIAKYELSLGEDQSTTLELHPEPIFRWTNQLNRRFYGDVYLWTTSGRPVAVVSITSVFGRVQKMEAEFHSLNSRRLEATRDDSSFWSPNSAGVDWIPIADAPEVAQTSRGRMLQMRALARRFEARSFTDDREWSLRLLPTPVYRNELHENATTDGALFAYVKGTDPDLFLLLQVQESDGNAEWRSAFARFTGGVSLEVVEDDQVIWSAPRLSRQKIRDPREPYFATQLQMSD